jgi:hypothetical protein
MVENKTKKAASDEMKRECGTVISVKMGALSLVVRGHIRNWLQWTWSFRDRKMPLQYLAVLAFAGWRALAFEVYLPIWGTHNLSLPVRRVRAWVTGYAQGWTKLEIWRYWMLVCLEIEMREAEKDGEKKKAGWQARDGQERGGRVAV